MVRKRWRPKKENILRGTGYDSMFEKSMHETKLKDCRFHDKEDKLHYTISHTYEPDFVTMKDGKTFYLELKGRFADNAEARKYLFIREVLDSEKAELVFIWQKANTAFPFSRRRKDGTRASHEEWADKHGFRHWTQEQFDIELL